MLTDEFEQDLSCVLAEVQVMLLAKNKSYGDSVLNPIRVFSRLDAADGIKIRIDDKLSRIARGAEFPDEDVIDDLIGYLILEKIRMKRETR